MYQLVDGCWRNANKILRANELQQGINGIVNGTDDMTSAHPVAIPVANRNRVAMLTISRLLLAQDPTRNDNIQANNNWNYVTPEIAGGLPSVLDALLNHWLEHGHLGYFPMMSTPRHENGFANLPLSRGIFNIVSSVMSRINDSQRKILEDYNAFISGKVSVFVPVSSLCYSIPGLPIVPPIGLHNFHLLPNIMQNVGYGHIDPDVGGALTLREAASNLLIALFSTNNITNIFVNSANNSPRFSLDITYAFPAPIPNATQTQNVGYNLTANVTNNVRLVLQVSHGIISVVSMYPY